MLSPTRQKCWVIFAEGREPTPTEESPEHNTREDEANWLLPPTWQMEEVPNWETDWSRMGEEAEAILAEGDKDLECPPPLKPFLQELMGGEESSLAKAEGGLPPPPQSMLDDLEPSPLCQAEWIKWHS